MIVWAQGPTPEARQTRLQVPPSAQPAGLVAQAHPDPGHGALRSGNHELTVLSKLHRRDAGSEVNVPGGVLRPEVLNQFLHEHRDLANIDPRLVVGGCRGPDRLVRIQRIGDLGSICRRMLDERPDLIEGEQVSCLASGAAQSIFVSE